MASQNESLGSSIAQLIQSRSQDLTDYENFYRNLHAHPELSLQESETAASVAKHRALSNFKIYTNVGGHGVAGVLSNGDGPTVLLRADMDALPVEEETGLEYASKVKTKEGTPVMHACGHDVHVTCLLAAAGWLASDEVRKHWSGTLVAVFQPNEERGQGARAMVDDGLYQKVPVPDVVLGQHVMPIRTGKVAVRKGTIVAAADSFKITVFGRGGHGSMPQLCIDPVILAANIVLRLQGIVSREIDPSEMAVLTVGSLQVGETENVIADRGVIKVDIRTQSSAVRERILKAMKRIVTKVCSLSPNQLIILPVFVL